MSDQGKAEVTMKTDPRPDRSVLYQGREVAQRAVEATHPPSTASGRNKNEGNAMTDNQDTPSIATGSNSPLDPCHGGDPILRWFAYEHLPEKLQETSKPFGDLAYEIVDTLPYGPERSTALRKLLEAKDAAVRAKLDKDNG